MSRELPSKEAAIAASRQRSAELGLSEEEALAAEAEAVKAAKKDRIAKRRASLFAGDTIEDLAPKEGPGRRTFNRKSSSCRGNEQASDRGPQEVRV